MECDICAVKNLIYQYADHIDRGELASVAAMFSHGRIVAGSGDGGAADIVGAESVEQLYRSFTRLYEDNGTPHTLHMTTNVMVDVDAAGASAGKTASARSCAVVFQAVDDFPLQPIISVRYYDRFENPGEGWRFSERRIETHMSGDLSRHLLRPLN